MAGEVLVVIRAFRNGHAFRYLVLEPLQDGGDVVRPLLLVLGEEVEDEPGKAALVGSRLGDERQVGRRGAAVRGPGGLLVRERRREVVRRTAGTLEHLALVVGTVLDLVVGREGGR